MITKFKLFENEKFRSWRYLDLEILENDNIKIILNDDGKQEAYDEGLNFKNFLEFFDDIRCNSDYEYFDDLSTIGCMTEAPGITYGYGYDDDDFNDIDNEEISDIYIYPDYMIRDFTEELLKNGFVIFQSSMKKTPEEIEEIRMNRRADKYNL